MDKEKTTNGAGASPHGEPGEHRRTRPPSGAREGAHGRVLLAGGYKGLSGNAYVVAEPGADGNGADGEPGPGPACAAMFDWVFYFDRTAGGRLLRAGLGGDEALAAMARRRADWASRRWSADDGTAGLPGQAGEQPK